MGSREELKTNSDERNSWYLPVPAGTIALTSPLNISPYGLNKTGPHAQFHAVAFLLVC